MILENMITSAPLLIRVVFFCNSSLVRTVGLESWSSCNCCKWRRREDSVLVIGIPCNLAAAAVNRTHGDKLKLCLFPVIKSNGIKLLGSLDSPSP